MRNGASYKKLLSLILGRFLIGGSQTYNIPRPKNIFFLLVASQALSFLFTHFLLLSQYTTSFCPFTFLSFFLSPASLPFFPFFRLPSVYFSFNITRKEPQKSSNPNNINSEILENTERKDQQQASQTNKSKSKNLQNNRDKSAQRKGNRKNKVNLNDRSQCEGTEEAKNSERKGGQQRETTSQRVKITIVGDSQLKRLDETKLSNHHHQVEIIAKGGSRIRQATQQVGKSESNIIVVHAGTNDIKSSNPEELSDAIIETLNKIQQNNPSSQIAYSSIFRRNDKNDLTPNRKVTEVNKIIEEKLNLHGFDFINNSNILFCNLWKDGLHINDGGIRKFAGNLSSYFRYC